MSSPNRHRAERDGCGCPSYVIWCRHIDGELVLCLRDTGAAKNRHLASCVSQQWPVQFSVANGGVVGPADCGCPMIKFWQATEVARFPDLPAAEAEFRRREAALLGQPPE